MGGSRSRGPSRVCRTRGEPNDSCPLSRDASPSRDEVVVMAQLRPDSALAKELDDAIKRDRATCSALVRATAVASTVTLKGTADSDAQRQLLGEVAARVRGVRAVNLQVAVSRASPRMDAEIASDVTDNLADDARLDRTRVSVEVRAKHAVLSGVVGSLAQRNAAVQDAWSAGVAGVDARTLLIDTVPTTSGRSRRPGARPRATTKSWTP